MCVLYLILVYRVQWIYAPNKCPLPSGSGSANPLTLQVQITHVLLDSTAIYSIVQLQDH